MFVTRIGVKRVVCPAGFEPTLLPSGESARPLHYGHRFHVPGCLPYVGACGASSAWWMGGIRTHDGPRVACPTARESFSRYHPSAAQVLIQPLPSAPWTSAGRESGVALQPRSTRRRVRGAWERDARHWGGRRGAAPRAGQTFVFSLCPSYRVRVTF